MGDLTTQPPSSAGSNNRGNFIILSIFSSSISTILLIENVNCYPRPKFTVSERFVGAILVIAWFNPFRRREKKRCKARKSVTKPGTVRYFVTLV
jgi:hypothetical protein